MMKILVTGGAGFTPLLYTALNVCGVETLKVTCFANRKISEL